ncbi:MAG TPA: hypothetical protein VN974_11260 [Candidatus Dormibacteraeota bacterium]|nr:hypothetical protein [Candidatus Dormibacteraeota bacterium]
MHIAITTRLALLFFIAGTAIVAVTNSYGQAAGSAAGTSGKSGTSKTDPAQARLSHGKKLILKDGNFQLVRSYERNGERVRYFSVERGDWEELPAAMVDWDATEKARIADEKTDAALVKKVQAQEQARQVVSVVDVDASLPVGQGVFLPNGEGMFAVTGKTVTPLEQVGAQTRTDKKRAVAQVISPVPLIPGKRTVEIPGAASKVRVSITTGPPEFYLREVAPDPDNPTSIAQSSRPGVDGPEVQLVRATVKGGKRRLKAIKSLLGQEISSEMDTVSIQRWEIAKNVYRFTLSEPLPPGEYALAEILPDGMNIFVWDFGVDATPGR